jgi:hypothetical protein
MFWLERQLVSLETLSIARTKEEVEVEEAMPSIGIGYGSDETSKGVHDEPKGRMRINLLMK